MDAPGFDALLTWLTEAGLTCLGGPEIHAGFCTRLEAAGLPMVRSYVVLDTLHPVHEGHVYRWNRGEPLAPAIAYGRAGAGYDPQKWEDSIFTHLLRQGETCLQVPVTDENLARFSFVEDLKRDGMTDHVCLVCPFGADGTLGAMDCFHVSFTTDHAHGFGPDAVATLRRLVPHLALAIKAVALKDVAATLVETYLGRDAGKRVLEGRIERGVAERIEAVLWFSDLRGYTRITDTAPDAVIPLLNDYAEAVVSAVEAQGGDVLKFMGDGVLAIFTEAEAGDACNAALRAAKSAFKEVARLNDRREASGLPITDLYLGLHRGAAFYGNIGSRERLDFTVVGPAVNEVARIATLCRSADQPMLMSSAFAERVGRGRDHLASVGRYALRGVARPQELFAIDPELLRPREPAGAPPEDALQPADAAP
jgi:adenylate cyclase